MRAWNPVAYAAAGVLLVLLWQFATVQFNYGGNWSALFCTGALQRVPPELVGTYVFPNSNGFDGQFYRYVAHDPWIERGWSRYMDAPSLRRMRILLPAAAWLLAFGQDRYIDAAYIVLTLASVFLGIYWLGRWSEHHGRHPAWGLGFILLPATLTSIDRMALDGALAALCAGMFWYYARGSCGRLCLVLAAAALTRETGLLLAGACCAWALSHRLWHRAALFALSVLPVFAWCAYVASRVAMVSPPGGWLTFFDPPLAGIVVRLFRPEPYPFGPLLTGLVQVLDGIALCGFIMALVLAVGSLHKRCFEPGRWLTLGLLAMVLTLGWPSYWGNVYNYARPLSPLLLLVALQGVRGRAALALAPVLLIDLRIAAQWAPQAWGILRGLL